MQGWACKLDIGKCRADTPLPPDLIRGLPSPPQGGRGCLFGLVAFLKQLYGAIPRALARFGSSALIATAAAMSACPSAVWPVLILARPRP